jgi:3-oxoacyl-(acyl-carrier-protein) synthase
MACYEAWLPPTIHLDNPDGLMNLNYVPNEKQELVDCTKRVEMKNTFGFGGKNSYICISE